MDNFLSFLDNVEELTEVQIAAKATRTKKDRNPQEDTMRLRVFKDGSIYPSKALAEKFNLEFQPVTITKEGDKTVKTRKDESVEENGLDVVNTNKWSQYPEGDGMKPLILISPVDKAESKVDLFGSTKYDDEGAPKTSVMEQGSNTYGKNELLPSLKEVYGIELGDDQPFIDMDVIVERDLGVLSKTGIFHLPKIYSRGPKKGDIDFTRRENINLYPLVPAVAEVPVGPGPEATEAPTTEEAAVGHASEAAAQVAE